MLDRKKPAPKAELAAAAREMLDPIIRPLRKLQKNRRRAMAQPRTTLERLKRDVEASARHLDYSSLNAPFLRMLDLIPDVEEMRQGIQKDIDTSRTELRADTIGAELLRLYDAADAAGPVSPLKFVCASTDEEVVDVFTIIGKFEEAQRAKGEKRIRILLEAMPDLLEKAYGRYLRTILVLLYLAEGEWPPRPFMAFGALVKDVIPRAQAYIGLVDADAGFLRNAVAHRHVEYLPATRSVEFRAPPAGWRLTLTAKVLEAKLIVMWRAATTLTNRLRSISSHEFALRSGMLAQLPLMRDAMRGEVDAAKALDEKTVDPALLSEVFRRKPPPGTDFWFVRTDTAD